MLGVDAEDEEPQFVTFDFDDHMVAVLVFVVCFGHAAVIVALCVYGVDDRLDDGRREDASIGRSWSRCSGGGRRDPSDGAVGVVVGVGDGARYPAAARRRPLVRRPLGDLGPRRQLDLAHGNRRLGVGDVAESDGDGVGLQARTHGEDSSVRHSASDVDVGERDLVGHDVGGVERDRRGRQPDLERGGIRREAERRGDRELTRGQDEHTRALAGRRRRLVDLGTNVGGIDVLVRVPIVDVGLDASALGAVAAAAGELAEGPVGALVDAWVRLAGDSVARARGDVQGPRRRASTRVNRAEAKVAREATEAAEAALTDARGTCVRGEGRHAGDDKLVLDRVAVGVGGNRSRSCRRSCTGRRSWLSCPWPGIPWCRTQGFRARGACCRAPSWCRGRRRRGSIRTCR